MNGLFSVLLQQSLTACWVIPAVLALRFALRKAPRHITNLLWLVVAFRLVCPVSFESNLSLLTQTKNAVNLVAELSVLQQNQPILPSEPLPNSEKDISFTPYIPQEVSPPLSPSEQASPTPAPRPETPEVIIQPEAPATEQILPSRAQFVRIGCGLWLGGMAFMMLNGLLSTRRWRKRVRTAVRDRNNIWRSESVDTPFILGVLRPKIYLPFVLPQGAEHHVIAHEQAHLRRRDPLMKFLAFALLSVYWFHPLVWISYLLFCRDMELACDQLVTRNLDAEGKKAYSAALLACTVAQGDPLLCPLSFGEVGVKTRIKAVLQKKPGKLLSFTALILCTILIIVCAADPKGKYEWKTAYQQELEHLLIQYGVNENYGLQSVDVVDLWQDNVPELVLVRRLDETEYGPPSTVLMVFEYANGEVQHRMTRHFDPGADLRWMRCDQGIRFLALLPSDAHPIVQTMETITITGEMDGGSYLSVEIPSYVQLDDGRWIEKLDRINKDSRYLTDEENASLLKDAKSLMDKDWQGFLKKNTGVLSYQRAYLDRITQLENRRQRPTRYSNLVDFNSDGYPELVTTCGDKLYVYRYDPEEGIADIVWTEELGCPYGEEDKRVFGINLTLERPALIVYFGPYPQSEFIEIYQWEEGDPIRRFPKLTLQAQGDESGRRDRMRDWISWYDDLTQEAYESLLSQYLQGAQMIDVRSEGWSVVGHSHKSQLHACEWDEPAVWIQEEPPHEGYVSVLKALMRQYGTFEQDPQTGLILGLKYAGLHDLGGDASPELVTLVNTKDADGTLHMTLRVYAADGKHSAKPVYQTELGGRYGQTDVSYSFDIGDTLLTHHTGSEWTEEVIHSYHMDNGTQVLHAATDGSNEFPTREALQQFFIDGEAVTCERYEARYDALTANVQNIDACWDISPATQQDLTDFLAKMNISGTLRHNGGYGETAAYGHANRLSNLLTIHGRSPEGIVGAMLVDLERDEIPELLVQRGMALELYRYANEESNLIWQGDIGLYFGQSDVSHQYVVNTHSDTPCIIVYDAEESWNEDVLRVITLLEGRIQESSLRAWTENNVFSPEWDNLDRFTIDGKSVSKIAYERRRAELTEGGMAVSAVHPYAYPNSDRHLDALLYQLSAQNDLTHIGDSAARAVAWWLMGTNDGEPLDEQTAMRFGAVFAQLAQSPIGSYPDSCLYLERGAFSLCRYEDDGSLILMERDETTGLCQGITYQFDETKGGLRRGVRFVRVETFEATLVGEFNGQTLVHRRYHTDCYSGMEDCQDCFRSDLILWNADRTQAVKLLENLPLANHFTVTGHTGNMVNLTYQTGPAHSEYNEVVLGSIDLKEKAYYRLSVTPPAAVDTEPTVAYGELTYRGKTYGLPQYSPLTSGGHTVEQAGKHLLITTHANPDHNVYDVFNTETLAFEKNFWGLALDRQGDDLTTLIYCQGNQLYTYDGFSLGSFAQAVDPNVLLVEGGRYSPDGKTFTVTYCDDTLLPKEESFPVPERAILEAANLLNGRGIWHTGLWFCPVQNTLTHEEAQTLAAELLQLYGPCSQWPFESAQISRTKSGSVKLTLLQPHSESKLCLDYTFYLEPDGTILQAEDCISDGYSGTLVYEDDNCAIIASRRAEGCLRGGDPCGYCYVADLTLWNAGRTTGTPLLEGIELGTNFTLLYGPDEKGVLTISYYTALSHSDSTTMVFGDIDLSTGTYTETAREDMPI